jgi:pilus assembly protein CpaE
MMKLSLKAAGAGETPPESAEREEYIAPAPRVSIQAFCASVETAASVQAAADDRRMAKAHLRVQMGGVAAAVEAYRSSPTPNVIVLEGDSRGEDILAGLDELSEVCDEGTRVVVIGRFNDIVLYRELIRRGVSDYLMAPVRALDVVGAICGLFSAPDAKPVGRVLAVVGAKGGVGSSTVAHNVAWAIARDLSLDSVVADLDLAFGTAGLDFNQDPPQGIAEAVFAPERLDANLVDRLLSKCSDRLSILAAPATADRAYDLHENAFDALVDILRASVPCAILDVPHTWTSWSRRMLISADELVVVAAPDLANLRNTKSLFDALRAARPNDAKPKLVLNFAGVPKRPEITTKDFAKAVEIDPIAVIPFEPKLFGTAANNGQMIAEVEANSKVADILDEIGRAVLGRAEIRKTKRTLLNPLMSRLRLKAS